MIKNFEIDLLKTLHQSAKISHKGENGRVLVIGGSSLFHGASLWAVELLSHFVDLVFYYSPAHINREIFLHDKVKFQNGIIVEAHNLENYVQEADVVVLGLGMLRRAQRAPLPYQELSIAKIEKTATEEEIAYLLTNSLVSKYPQKKWVIDAGALQEIELANLSKNMILTPHFQEYSRLWPEEKSLSESISEEKILASLKGLKQQATIMLKFAGVDYIYDPSKNNLIKSEGGNEGLTKGGTGDLLAALSGAFYVKNPPALAAAAASFILKKSAEELYKTHGPNYSTTELLAQIPLTYWSFIKS